LSVEQRGAGLGEPELTRGSQEQVGGELILELPDRDAQSIGGWLRT
jgi:hypothetical protein